MTEVIATAGCAGALLGILIAWLLQLAHLRINWPALLALLPARRRCAHSPLDLVRCSRRRGHFGRHMVYAADVVNAHYERTPF